MEWIGDCCFDGVETFDCIAVCKHKICLSIQVGVHRCRDMSGGAVGGVGKQGQG